MCTFHTYQVSRIGNGWRDPKSVLKHGLNGFTRSGFRADYTKSNHQWKYWQTKIIKKNMFCLKRHWPLSTPSALLYFHFFKYHKKIIKQDCLKTDCHLGSTNFYPWYTIQLFLIQRLIEKFTGRQKKEDNKAVAFDSAGLHTHPQHAFPYFKILHTSAPINRTVKIDDHMKGNLLF